MKNQLGVAVALAWLALAGLAAGQSSREDCEVLRVPFTSLSIGLKGIYESFSSQDESAALSKLKGAEREAVLEMQAARLAFLKSLEQYVTTTEDAAYAFTRCAR